MKIGDSINNYYRSQSQASGGAAASLPLTTDSGSQRTQAPTVSVSGSASSSSLSSALWISLAGKLENEDGTVTAAPTENSAADEFMKWSKMSPDEKIRAQILESKNLTEVDLLSMDADQSAAIEAEIKEAIKRQLGIEDEAGEAATSTASDAGI